MRICNQISDCPPQQLFISIYGTGSQYIFGGTALERDKGSELTVTYELTVDSGTAKLYWLDKGEEKMIADTSKNGTYSVTLDEGDNYLTLEGNDFCGSLQVVVE